MKRGHVNLDPSAEAQSLAPCAALPSSKADIERACLEMSALCRRRRGPVFLSDAVVSVLDSETGVCNCLN